MGQPETEIEILETIEFDEAPVNQDELYPVIDSAELLKHGHHKHKPDQRRKRKHQKRKLKREASHV